MNTVRPLVTITILVVVGAYLYVKINQGPVRPLETSDAWHNDSIEGVPPLETSASEQSLALDTAPAWPATGQAAATSSTLESAGDPAVEIPPVVATADASSSAGTSPQALPTVPTIPALPEVSTPVDAAGQAQIASVPPPANMPANIPTARYPEQSTPEAAETGPAATATLNGSIPFSQNSPQPAAQSTTTVDTQSNSEYLIPETSIPQSPPAQNPLRQANQPNAVEDRYASIYGQYPTAPAESGMSAPVEPSFAASWPGIQTALEQGNLSEAHQLLSKWYDEPSLTPTEAERVEALLSQLAGTVVYSTEHLLEPARVVKPGETLQTIASEYNVPWKLLAKINGIPAADQVQPGQELKVVRGPFSAVMDLDRNEFVLTLEGRYAGKFPMSTQPGIEPPVGDWLLQHKLASENKNTSAPTGVPGYAVTVKHLVLQNISAQSPESVVLVIGSEPVRVGSDDPTNGASPATQPAQPYFVKASPTDIEELADILSIGSRVVIRR